MLKRINSSYFFYLLYAGPFIYWLYLGFNNELGIQPIVLLNQQSGWVVLSLLLINLLLGNIHSLFKLNNKLFIFFFRRRRGLGITTSIYLTIHILTYFTKEGYLMKAWTQIFTKPYLINAFVAALVIFVMTITSNTKSIRWLGHTNWKSLHRLIHLSSIAILIHIFSIEKGDLVFSFFLVSPLIFLQTIRLCIFSFTSIRNFLK